MSGGSDIAWISRADRKEIRDSYTNGDSLFDLADEWSLSVEQVQAVVQAVRRPRRTN